MFLPDEIKLCDDLGKQVVSQGREVHFRDAPHRRGVRKLNIVEKAASEEGVGQFFLAVARDDDDRPAPGLEMLPGLDNVETHLVQLVQEVVGKLQVRLVDFVDQ